jgi:hypothetical protein
VKTYIAVPFAANHRAKARGAQWDMARKSWFVPDGVDLAAFREWLPKELAAWFGGTKQRKRAAPVALAKPAQPSAQKRHKKRRRRPLFPAEMDRRLDRKALRKLRHHGLIGGAA